MSNNRLNNSVTQLTRNGAFVGAGSGEFREVRAVGGAPHLSPTPPPHDYPDGTSIYHILDHALTPPLFFMAVIFLFAVSGVLHRFKYDEVADARNVAGWVVHAIDEEVDGHEDPNSADQNKKEAKTPNPGSASEQAPTTKDKEESPSGQKPIQALVATVEVVIMFWALVILWPILALDAFVRFYVRRGQRPVWSRFGFLIATLMFPPLRIGARSYLDPHLYWLPIIGWNHADKDLRRKVEKIFSVPMIVIALMVLPVLAVEAAIEYVWPDLRGNFSIKIAVDIGNALIWAAFAFELIVMLSLAEKKLAYCITHWIDLAVVLLPLSHFLPALRLLRAGRLVAGLKLGRMARLYRLRGLAMRAWRSILVLQVLQRLFNNSLEKRLNQLQELKMAKLEELEELEMEIESIENQIRKAGREVPVEQ
ncbi:MAG: hypothetical protein ACFCD0_21690 [Gemmataceae bacterium]